MGTYNVQNTVLVVESTAVKKADTDLPSGAGIPWRREALQNNSITYSHGNRLYEWGAGDCVSTQQRGLVYTWSC